MRKVFIGLMAFTLILLAPIAFAAVAVNENGTYQGEAVTLDMPSAWVDSFDGSTATIGGEGTIRFYPQDFMNMGDTDTAAVEVISASTTPGYELDNKSLSLVWADQEQSYVSVTFIVPPDYASGGGFRVLTDQSNALSKCAVDFCVYVTTPGTEATPWDTTVTDQTPAWRTMVGDGSPESVTLTVTTDFASLAAGDVVTLYIWRDNSGLDLKGTAVTTTGVAHTNANATADLEVHYVEFYYSRN